VWEYDDELNYGVDRRAVEGEVLNLPDNGTVYGRYLQSTLGKLLGTNPMPVDAFADLHASNHEPPRHFVYFHDRDLADLAAAAVRDMGFEPSVLPSSDQQKPWLLLAGHRSRTATEDDMEDAAARLQRVAEEWGGEYDGWDKPP
jgi:hypothetical protein